MSYRVYSGLPNDQACSADVLGYMVSPFFSVNG